MTIAKSGCALKDMDTHHVHAMNGATFFSMQLAPMNGEPVRVLISEGSKIRELPWRLYFTRGFWCYETTGGIVHSWHEPAAWSSELRTPEFEAECQATIAKGRGALRGI